MVLERLSPELYRKIVLLVFFVLIVTIITTPLLVRRGFSILDEEMFESFLLFIQVALVWYVFQLYEMSLTKKEQEMKKLESEYQKREKELLETFTYLGKVNVQISFIKDFLRKLKAPKSKREVKEYLNDILRMALSISKKDWLSLRIIDTDTMHTLSEYWVGSTTNGNGEIKIGNKEIVSLANDLNICNENGYCVLTSVDSKAEKERAYLIFKEKGETDREVIDFMRAAVNQCAIVHILFVLGSRNP